MVLEYGKETHDLLDVVRGKVAQVAAALSTVPSFLAGGALE